MISGHRLRSAALMASLIFGIACSAPVPEAPKPPPEPPAAAPATEARFGEEFQLSPGGQATIPAGDVTIEFAEVTEDSRCPIGARCIWAGQVTVLLKVAQAGAPLGEPKLTLRVDEPQPASGQVGTLQIRLLSVEPYPEPEKPIERADYVARLVVEHASGDRQG